MENKYFGSFHDFNRCHVSFFEQGFFYLSQINKEQGSEDQVGLRSHFSHSPHNSRLRSAISSLPNIAKKKVKVDTNTLRSLLEKEEKKRRITKLVIVGKWFNVKTRKLFRTLSVMAPIKIFKSFSLYFFIRPRAIVSPPVFVMDVFVIVNLKSNITEEWFLISYCLFEQGFFYPSQINGEQGSKDQVGLRSHFLLSPHNSRLRSAVNSLPNMAKEKVTNTLRSSLEKG